jgi:hypothetical protein
MHLAHNTAAPAVVRFRGNSGESEIWREKAQGLPIRPHAQSETSLLRFNNPDWGII